MLIFETRTKEICCGHSLVMLNGLDQPHFTYLLASCSMDKTTEIWNKQYEYRTLSNNIASQSLSTMTLSASCVVLQASLAATVHLSATWRSTCAIRILVAATASVSVLGYKCLWNDGFTGSAFQFNLEKIKCCADYNSNITCEHQSVSGIRSSLDDNQICKTHSRCKNRILDGMICDKCADYYGPSTDKSFYNKFCELHAKYFPKGKNAFMALPGILNRFRFNIRLTFATIKPSGYLFHNERLSPTTRNFISLKINKGMFIFYGLWAIQWNKNRGFFSQRCKMAYSYSWLREP